MIRPTSISLHRLHAILPLITHTCNVSEGTGIVDSGDHLVLRYFLPKAFLLAFLVNKSERNL